MPAAAALASPSGQQLAPAKSWRLPEKDGSCWTAASTNSCRFSNGVHHKVCHGGEPDRPRPTCSGEFGSGHVEPGLASLAPTQLQRTLASATRAKAAVSRFSMKRHAARLLRLSASPSGQQLAPAKPLAAAWRNGSCSDCGLCFTRMQVQQMVYITRSTAANCPGHVNLALESLALATSNLALASLAPTQLQRTLASATRARRPSTDLDEATPALLRLSASPSGQQLAQRNPWRLPEKDGSCSDYDLYQLMQVQQMVYITRSATAASLALPRQLALASLALATSGLARRAWLRHSCSEHWLQQHVRGRPSADSR